MAVAGRVATTTRSDLTTYVQRGMEFLWLLTAIVVPLIFVKQDWMLSEAVNAYVEVPKTTALRTLVGMMTILWIVEWVLKGGLNRHYNVAQYPTRLKNWLEEQPSRWVVVAAVIYVVVALISTSLSVAPWRSIWGEVPAQFGYSAYTTISYFLLFAVIATHLKTRPQLWRLLGVTIATGALVALYAIVQHYDFNQLDMGKLEDIRLNMGEAGHIRVSATMANPVFTGAFLVTSSLFTLGIGLTLLNTLGWTPARIALWVALVAAQLITVYWTGSRGSWLLGVPWGLVALLALPLLSDVITSLAREKKVPFGALGLLGTVGILGLLVLLAQLDMLDLGESRPLLGTLLDLPVLRLLVGFMGVMGLMGVVILLFPEKFSQEVRTSAKTILVVASVILVTLLVITLTPTPSGGPELDLRDFSGLPDLGILLGMVGLVGGVSILAIVFAARVGEGVTFLAKGPLVLASGLLIVLLTAGLTLPGTVTPAASNDPATTLNQDGDQTPTLSPPPAVVRKGLSYRTEIWEGGLGLVVNRPWFEYESLPLSYLRPAIGYGPELFKYTFPLESPLGGLLSQAHNFFLHHWIEQGILGLFSSVGLFAAFFIVGLAQLWRNWWTYSATHKWILVALLGAVAGRVVEMLVGVARESDLVPIWILLAIFVVLPSIMGDHREVEASTVPEGQPGPQRRGRQAGRTGRRERRARQTRGGSGEGLGSPDFPLLGLLLVSAVVIFIGWLTWDKNVDYFWAGTIAASSRDQFQEGQLQSSHELMEKAISKAPDIPSYYNSLAGVYDSYRRFATQNPGTDRLSCEEVFDLEPGGQVLRREGLDFARCAEEAYLSNRRGFEKNTTSPQAKLVLANSTLDLALIGYGAGPDGNTYPCYIPCDEEAVQYYDELTKMIPSSWPLQNALGTAYLRLGQPQEALSPLGASLTISKGAQSARAYYLEGVAYQQLNDQENTIVSFERGLGVDENGPNSAEIRRQLLNIYNVQAQTLLQQNMSEEAFAYAKKSVDTSKRPNETAISLYLQGLVYQQMEELQKAVDSLEQSLEVDKNGPHTADARRVLADIKTVLEVQDRGEEESGR